MPVDRADAHSRCRRDATTSERCPRTRYALHARRVPWTSTLSAGNALARVTRTHTWGAGRRLLGAGLGRCRTRYASSRGRGDVRTWLSAVQVSHALRVITRGGGLNVHCLRPGCPIFPLARVTHTRTATGWYVPSAHPNGVRSPRVRGRVTGTRTADRAERPIWGRIWRCPAPVVSGAGRVLRVRRRGTSRRGVASAFLAGRSLSLGLCRGGLV